MAWLLLIPVDASRWNVTCYGVGSARRPTSSTALILADPFQNASYRADTDSLQLPQQDRGDWHLAMLGQLSGRARQNRCEALRADMVQSLENDSNGILDRWAIGSATLYLSGFARQCAIHEPYQALAMLPSNLFHLVQKHLPTCPIRFSIPSLHHRQILSFFVN